MAPRTSRHHYRLLKLPLSALLPGWRILLPLFLILLTPLMASGCESGYPHADYAAVSKLLPPSDTPEDRQLVDDEIKIRKIRQLQIRSGSYKTDPEADHASAWLLLTNSPAPHLATPPSRKPSSGSQDVASPAALHLPPAQAPPA